MMQKLQYLLRRTYNKLPYPLHLNIIAIIVNVFGSVRLKVLYDCFRRPDYAYGVYEAAKRAKNLGLEGITVMEFGVATGRGLMAMIMYAEKVSAKFGIKIEILGFDSGEGMPSFTDYRDHPELYTMGDFPMIHRDRLMKFLPPNSKLVLLNLINEPWTKTPLKYPIGFISIDVDYYSSTMSILQQLQDINSNLLLPNTLMYFDDVILDNHNAFQGELLAINEFNAMGTMRKIDFFGQTLRHSRMYKNAPWIDNMYQLHVLDHKHRQNAYRSEESAAMVITNKYFR